MTKKGAPIILLLLLLCAPVLISQELLKPVLKFTNACASNSFNTYEVEVTYINNFFNQDNVFSLELSDGSGDFTNAKTVKTISNQNSSFRFTTSFNLPEDTAGSNYKIRVKASSPEKMSPESDAFEAYFMSSDMLVLNNFENVALCDGESQEISANVASTYQIQWYKDGQKLILDDATITVDEAGLYYCEIYYGSCNSPATSNIVEVTKSDALLAEIKGDSTINLCENETRILEASIDNALYTYSWFKDGVQLTSLPLYSPSITVSSETQPTKYYVEITNENGCSATSAEVTVNNVSTNFSVTTNTTTPTFILAGESKVLAITHNASNAEITWFKDNVPLANSNTTSLTITEPGVYFASVKNTANSCSETKNSETIVVNSVKSFEATITTSTDYSECISAQTQLLLESLVAIASNDITYNLTPEQIALLNFQWFKDSSPLSGSTNQQITIGSFEDNGNYFLEITNGSVVSNSNNLDINLKLPDVSISSDDTTNTFCDSRQVTLSTQLINGLNYQWFLNGSAIANATTNTFQISQIGVYYVELSNEKGCTSKSNEITITNVDTNFSVNTNTSTPTFILSGETKVLAITHDASNTEITWFKDDIQIANSNTTNLTITESGVYFASVKNTVNGCSETKNSETIVVNSIERFDANIKTLPDYSECSSIKTQLLLELVKAVDKNGNVYDLNNNQISLLNFNWYKDNNPLVGFTQKQITVETHESNGSYFLEVVNGTAISNSNSLAIKLGVLQPEITSNDQTNTFCDSKQIILNTTQQNDVSYQWFLNGNAIANATETSFLVDSAGVYQIEVTNQSGCSKISNEFTVNHFNSNFTVSSTTASPTFILAGETKILNVTHNAQNAETTWFKDDIAIPNSNTNNLEITEPGVYYAIVKHSISGCSETKSIDNIIVNSIESFTATIKALPTYAECSSAQTQLFLDSVQVKDTSGRFYVLTSEQITILEFRWFKDSILVNGANNRQIAIDGFEQNGTYFLEIINDAISSKSNVLDIKLGLPEITITSNDNSNSLCDGKEISLTTTEINGVSYQWFFNGSTISMATNNTITISEIGKYTVEISGFGCSKTAQEFTIDPFDATGITFNFDDEITLQEGESIVVSANGADRYEWYDENDNLIETSSSLEINKDGNYRVIAYLNGCSVEKLFTVTIVSGNVYVPNILTPNGDGINDYWKIPSELAFKNNIEIEIISISGKTVLKQKNYQNNWPEDPANIASLYFYIIREEQNIIKKGTINILK